MSAAAIATVFAYAMQALLTGAQVYEIVVRSRDALDIMVKERRDPTAAELDAIFGRIEAANERIQKA